MKNVSKDQYLKILYSCVDDCDKPYCFLKVFLEHQHPDPRILCQFKCIDIFKWEESEKAGYDIGLRQAGFMWCEGAGKSWAAAFSHVYEEDELPVEIYRRTKELYYLMNSGILDSSNVTSVSTLN